MLSSLCSKVDKENALRCQLMYAADEERTDKENVCVN